VAAPLGTLVYLEGRLVSGGLRRLGLDRRTTGEGPWTAARRVEPSVPENRERAGREHTPAAVDPQEFQGGGPLGIAQRLGSHPARTADRALKNVVLEDPAIAYEGQGSEESAQASSIPVGHPAPARSPPASASPRWRCTLRLSAMAITPASRAREQDRPDQAE
jgi:hypothetical protein